MLPDFISFGCLDVLEVITRVVVSAVDTPEVLEDGFDPD